MSISVCGLTCNSCPLYNLPYDEKSANKILDWFRYKGWYKDSQTVSDIIKSGDYCKGCKSDRSDIHWSPNCSLLLCCIDKKQLKSCSECGDFPCKEYKKWIEQGKNHKMAYKNLIRIKEGKAPIIVNF